MKPLLFLACAAVLASACQAPSQNSEAENASADKVAIAAQNSKFFEPVIMIEKGLQKHISEVGPSIAYIEITLKSGSLEKTNTQKQTYNGIVVDERGYIATLPINEEQVQKISLWILEQEFQAEIIDVDRKNGFSLLKIDTDEKLKPLTFGDTSKLRNGQTVFSVNSTGSELDFEPSASFGQVHAVIFGKNDIILTNNLNLRHHPMLPTLGMPILNAQSQVIGIATDRVVLLSDTLEKAVNTKLHDLENDNGTKKDKENAWFGLGYQPVNRDQAEALKIPRNSLLITKVYYDSAAGEAGIQNYDLITGINGIPFTRKGMGALSQMNKHSDISVGDKVSLTILRDGQSFEKDLIITAKPQVEELKVEEFGVSFRSIRSIEYFAYGLPRKEGLMISKIEAGSPAATSTYFGRPLLYRGDVIKSINNTKITNIAQLRTFLDDFRRSGEKKALIRLYRGNYQSTINLNTAIGQKSEEK